MKRILWSAVLTPQSRLHMLGSLTGSLLAWSTEITIYRQQNLHNDIYVDIKKCGPLAAKPAGGAGRRMPASSLLHLLSLALSVHLNLTLVAQTPWKMSRSWAMTMAPGPSDYAPALNCHGNGMVNFTRCHYLSDHGWSFTATSVATVGVDTVTSLSHLRRDTDSNLRHITMATQNPAGCIK